MRSPLLKACAVAWATSGSALISGCTTGHPFSIAMVDPGAPQTVLIVGDGDPGAAESSTAIATAAASPAIAMDRATTLSQIAAMRAQAPVPQALTAQGAVGVSNAVGPISSSVALSTATTTNPATQIAALIHAVAAPIGSVASTAAPLEGVASPLVASSLHPVASLVASTSITAQAATPLESIANMTAATLASSTAPLQATLAGPTSAISLAPPSPGKSTPAAAILKTLAGPVKKLKHG